MTTSRTPWAINAPKKALDHSVAGEDVMLGEA
jgi:hypothetical protein